MINKRVHSRNIVQVLAALAACPMNAVTYRNDAESFEKKHENV